MAHTPLEVQRAEAREGMRVDLVGFFNATAINVTRRLKFIAQIRRVYDSLGTAGRVEERVIVNEGIPTQCVVECFGDKGLCSTGQFTELNPCFSQHFIITAEKTGADRIDVCRAHQEKAEQLFRRHDPNWPTGIRMQVEVRVDASKATLVLLKVEAGKHPPLVDLGLEASLMSLPLQSLEQAGLRICVPIGIRFGLLA